MKRIDIDGVIGWDVFASDIRAAIREAGNDDKEFAINSPGGSVTEGIAIFNEIKNASGNNSTHIVGIAASMGSYIALAAPRVTAERNAIFMIHNASMVALGDHRTLRKAADIAEGMSKILASAYVAKTGKKPDEIRAMMDAETFLYGDEIGDMGFADEMSGDPPVEEKAAAVMQTRAAVASADDLIKRLSTPQDYDQAAALMRDILPKAQVNPGVAGIQAAGPKIKKEGRMELTIDQIKAEAPNVAAALRDEGAKDERARIMGLEAWSDINADCAKIVAEAKASGKRYEDVAAQLGAAAAKGRAAPAANGENAPAVATGTAGNASGADDVLDDVDREAAALFGYDAATAKKFKEVK